MGLVLPKGGFLQGLRAVTERYGALLLFDEVMTGFRVAPGGAQAREGVVPDLTTLGKILGGGLPVGAFGGRAEIMAKLAPDGPVYQAGTLSGNPVAMAAGLATLRALRAPGAYEKLERLGALLERGLAGALEKGGVAHFVARAGSMLTMFFTSGPVVDLESAKTSDTVAYGHFFHALLDRGVYVAPSQFECWFLSLAHTDADIERTLRAVDEVLPSGPA